MRKFTNFSLILLCLLCNGLVLFISCNKPESGKRKTKEQTHSNIEDTITSKYKPDYNLYIENSGSMEGYLNGSTRFKNTISDIIAKAHANQLQDSISLNFVSDKVCTTNINALPADIKYFLTNLNKERKINKCDAKISDLPNVINTVLLNGREDVNILVSDCILSLDNNQNNTNAAKNTLLMLITNELHKSSFSTVILKYNSEFDGLFYPGANNSTIKLTSSIQRPYYLLIFGKSVYLNELLKNLDFTSFDGFENSHYVFVPQNMTPSAKIIRSPMIGQADVATPASSLTLNNIKTGNRQGQEGVFKYSVAIDLSFLRYDKEFLLNPANYEVTKGFQVSSIKPNDDPTNSSLNGFTHVFSITTTDLKPRQEVVLKLNPRLPEWVSQSTTSNDTNPYDSVQKHQTFGLESLIKGITEAYDTKYKDQNQFSITMHLSTNDYNNHGKSSSFSWWWIILLTTFVGFIIWVKTKK
jgi:hypothetical protein